MDRRLLFHAMIGLPVVAVMVRWLGVRRSQNFLIWLAPLRTGTANNPTADVSAARGLAYLVRIAATRGIYSANCLERSLVLWWLLREQGITGDIRYGAHTGDQGFKAHAWVEVAGHVLGDHSDIKQHFVPFEPAVADHRAKLAGHVPEVS